MIPLVKIYGSLRLLDNKWSLIYMYIGFGSPLADLHHGFIKSIPLELEESGSHGWLRQSADLFPYRTGCMPTTVTISVLNVLWIWNDFLLPSLVLTSSEQRTLPLSTFYFYGTYTVDYGPLMAGLVFTCICPDRLSVCAEVHYSGGHPTGNQISSVG